MEWKRANSCVVEFVKTPCRTVRYRIWSFENLAWGIHDVASRTFELLWAVDLNGSTVETVTGSSRHHWIVPESRNNGSQIVLRPQDEVISVDHERRIYDLHGGARSRGQPMWEEDDGQCSHTASHYLYLHHRLADSVVAQVRVVGYSGRDDRGADYKIYFAPSIGCQEFHFESTARNAFGLPTQFYYREVTSYELGPPDPELYRIPWGYQKVER